MVIYCIFVMIKYLNIFIHFVNYMHTPLLILYVYYTKIQKVSKDRIKMIQQYFLKSFVLFCFFNIVSSTNWRTWALLSGYPVRCLKCDKKKKAETCRAGRSGTWRPVLGRVRQVEGEQRARAGNG